MTNSDYDIKTLLDIPEWEKIQDELAALTGTAIITIDYKGTPVSKHSARTAFCTVIRENPVSAKRCYKCDALAGLEAVRMNKPFIYLCHCGIVDVAVPVMVGDRYIGAVMFGQVRIPNDKTHEKVQRLISEISSFNETDGSEDLMEMYKALPELTYEKIEQIADLLDSIVKYIVKRAMKERAGRMALEYRSRNTLPPVFDGDSEEADLRLGDLSARSEPPYQDTCHAVLGNMQIASPVYPALCYIEQHYGDAVGMKEMADLCNLSPAYFSRLFKKEMGENFTDYVNRRKIGLAKETLRGGKESVSEIAARLGFQDASYFVKVFRRYEGITPTAYRKHR